MEYKKYIEQTGAYVRAKFKEVPQSNISVDDKLVKVQDILVTVKVSAGEYTFQGDEMSQTRLVRVGWALDKSARKKQTWKTSDNQEVELTVADIAKIVSASIATQDKLWLK